MFYNDANVKLLQSVGGKWFQGHPETRIVRGLDLKSSSFLCFHHLNISAIITFSIFTAAILSMPTTFLPFPNMVFLRKLLKPNV